VTKSQSGYKDEKEIFLGGTGWYDLTAWFVTKSQSGYKDKKEIFLGGTGSLLVLVVFVAAAMAAADKAEGWFWCMTFSQYDRQMVGL
jgi:hypothetical protein